MQQSTGPNPSVVAGGNVAFWAARQIVLASLGWFNPNIIARLTCLAVSATDTYLTYQTSRSLLRLSMYDQIEAEVRAQFDEILLQTGA